MSLGKKIDEYYAARAARIEEEQKVKDLKQIEDGLKQEILGMMSEVDLSKASGTLATVSISEQIVPTVVDWDKFYNHIHRHKAYHLLERRPSVAAYKEELEERNGKDIPGTEPFTRVNLNMSKSTK